MHLSTLPLRVLVASAAISCISGASVIAQESASAPVQQARVQRMIDELTARLGISDAVRASIVPVNHLLMSVEPTEHVFELKVEDGWIDGLDDAELRAGVAHE